MSVSTKAMRLCYLLIALLVFQTAVAFYDRHERRQDMATHIPPHHLDVAGNRVKILAGTISEQVSSHASDLANDTNPEQGPEFCHHCCHCHSFGFVGLVGSGEQPSYSGRAVIRASVALPFPSVYFPALYRPPIARV